MQDHCSGCGHHRGKAEAVPAAPDKVTSWDSKPIGDQVAYGWVCLNCGKLNHFSPKT